MEEKQKTEDEKKKRRKQTDLSYSIIRVLKENSSKEKPITQKEIIKNLKKLYGEENVSEKSVRRSLVQLRQLDENFGDKKCVEYREYDVGKGDKVRTMHTDYYYINTLSDSELKFLIDSVMYSKILDKETALDLAKRIQGLSGKYLKDSTRYVSNNFGELRYNLDIDVLKNVEVISEAIDRNKFISFDWNVYDVEGVIYTARFKGNRVMKPLYIIMDSGRYYLHMRYENSSNIYTYSVDLMNNINIVGDMADDGLGNGNLPPYFIRAQYALRHPYMMGGEINRYKLRVNTEYFSRLVDSFSYEIMILPGTQTETTVDVLVPSSKSGMKYWLLQNYEVAELIGDTDSNKELRNELREAVEALYSKYVKVEEVR